MLSDGLRTYTWEHGRQLKCVTTGSTEWYNLYDENGIRTEHTRGTVSYKYSYEGGKLKYMSVGATKMYFTYDFNGAPLSVNYNGTEYYYVTNLQGDVVAILNAAGTAVVTYTYDAWGNPLTQTGSLSSTLGTHNPLRYRGYVYDTETQLYYLQSRYYNPEIGRFINGDAYASTGQGLLGTNMFAYCNNNPINFVDSSGMIPRWIVAAVVVIAIVSTSVIAECTMPSQTEHYARNENNITGINRIEDVPMDWKTSNKEDETRQTGPAANAHQFTSEDRTNVKYVSPDEKHELIFNKNNELVTDPRDIGTYNFGTGIVKHYVLDVKPWIRWGNTPDDTTTSWQRMWALIGLY